MVDKGHLIRLAAGMPKGSRERRAILQVLARGSGKVGGSGLQGAYSAQDKVTLMGDIREAVQMVEKCERLLRDVLTWNQMLLDDAEDRNVQTRIGWVISVLEDMVGRKGKVSEAVMDLKEIQDNLR